MLKQVEPLVQSPEQMLKSLEMEIAFRRGQRATGSSRRLAIVAAGTLVLLGAGVALLVLFSTLNNLRHTDGRMEATSAASAR